jgi:hypothetical protein
MRPCRQKGGAAMIDISPRDVPLDDDDWAPPLPETDGSVDCWGLVVGVY